jgi:hypothetical protein
MTAKSEIPFQYGHIVFFPLLPSKWLWGPNRFISNSTGALTPETLLPGFELIIHLSNAEVKNAWVCKLY